MEKDFDTWNEEKKRIDSIAEGDFPRPKRRQIWWCAIGMNVGSEQGNSGGFERPVLVVKVFGSMFWGIPITSSDPEGKKEQNPLFFKLENIPYTNEAGNQKTLHGFLALHQLRIFDGRRLKRKILKMEEGLFEVVLRELRSHI